MNIVPASENDIALIQKIAHQSWNENYSEMISQEQIEYMLRNFYSQQELQEHFLNPDYFYFFIENESGEKVGFMGCERNFEVRTTKLHRLYLIKAEKGKNLGKFALNYLKNWTKQEQNIKIILNVNKTNTAIKFYEKLGFKIYDQGNFSIGGGFYMDDYLMEFALN